MQIHITNVKTLADNCSWVFAATYHELLFSNTRVTSL